MTYTIGSHSRRKAVGSSSPARVMYVGEEAIASRNDDTISCAETQAAKLKACAAARRLSEVRCQAATPSGADRRSFAKIWEYFSETTDL